MVPTSIVIELVNNGFIVRPHLNYWMNPEPNGCYMKEEVFVFNNTAELQAWLKKWRAAHELSEGSSE